MSESLRPKRFPSNSETGCVDSTRLALLQKLAQINVYSSQAEILSQSKSHQRQQSQSDHKESQRSNSLFDLLNNELSQTSHNTYNMPRQVKSLFSANDSNFPPQKELIATLETDMHHTNLKREQTPKKSLKQSIYQKLLRGKSKNKAKHSKNKIVQQIIKQATFRPQKGTLKSIANDAFKVKNHTNSKIRSTLNTEQTPRNMTKYEELLKYSNFVQKQKQKEKENNNGFNFQSDLIIPIGRTISQKDVIKLNLKKSLQLKRRFCQNQYVSEPQKIGMLDLNFEERQQKCIRSKSLKVIQNEIDKLKKDMVQCTFKPILTPYRRSISRGHIQTGRSYAQIKRISNKQLVHFR